MYKPRTTPDDKNSPHQKRGSASLILSKVHRILDAQPALVSDPHLSHEIEKALTVESADMVLLTLKRLDESILLGPHMIPAWKRLADRLAALDPESALKYTAEMSLYWDPYYADGMASDVEGPSHALQQNQAHVLDFIRGIQAVGNELDVYGTGIWARLMGARVSNEPIDHLLYSILDTFPTSIFGTGYCRTPFGVHYSFMQSCINPDFRKCAAETYLSILAEFIPENPEEGIFFITCVMNSLIGEDYPSIMEKFFEHWKTCIQYIAQKDAEEAISYIDGDTDFPMFQDRKEKLKLGLSGNVSRGVLQSTPDKLPQKAFEAAQMWCLDNKSKQGANIWRQIILQTAKKNPEFAIHDVYASITPFRSKLVEDNGESYMAEQITEVVTTIIDTLADTDMIRALHLCVYILREERYAFFYFSLEDLSRRILEYIHEVGASHPDVALEGYTLIDKGIECSMHWGVPGMSYLTGIDERHKKIFDFIPRAAGKNILTSISACERLLLRTDKDSETHSQTLTLWRQYMRELKKRNAVMAAERYSQLCATIKKRDDDLFIECEKGYKVDCLEDVQKQRRTVTPLEQSLKMIEIIDNPET